MAVQAMFALPLRALKRLPLLFKDVYLLEVKGYSHVDWTFTPEHLKTYHTVEKAYNYWTQRRPNRYSPLHAYNGPIPPLDGKCTDEEQYEWDWACELDTIYERMYEKEDQQMLRDVLEERLNLWC